MAAILYDPPAAPPPAPREYELFWETKYEWGTVFSCRQKLPPSNNPDILTITFPEPNNQFANNPNNQFAINQPQVRISRPATTIYSIENGSIDVSGNYIEFKLAADQSFHVQIVKASGTSEDVDASVFTDLISKLENQVGLEEVRGPHVDPGAPGAAGQLRF